MDQFEG